MVPEFIVLFVSLLGIVVSGYLLYDAAQDRMAVKTLKKVRGGVGESELDSFTRHRGVAEAVRFISLLAWFYVAAASVVGNEFFRRTIMWVLVFIPILITAGSIHSWWAKRRWIDARALEEARNGSP